MNSFIKKLKEMSSGKPTAADIDGEKYENNTYAIKSLYPDRETKERIEEIIRQKKRKSGREDTTREDNTYAFKSLYPDRETKERIERIIRQKICESERE